MAPPIVGVEISEEQSQMNKNAKIVPAPSHAF
jgi:hypothetical protein